MFLCRSLPPGDAKVTKDRHRASLSSPVPKCRQSLQTQPNPFSQLLEIQQLIGNLAAPNPTHLSSLDSIIYFTKSAHFSIPTNGPRDPRMRRSANCFAFSLRLPQKALKQSPNVVCNHHKSLAGGSSHLQRPTRTKCLSLAVALDERRPCIDRFWRSVDCRYSTAAGGPNPMEGRRADIIGREAALRRRP